MNCFYFMTILKKDSQSRFSKKCTETSTGKYWHTGPFGAKGQLPALIWFDFQQSLVAPSSVTFKPRDSSPNSYTTALDYGREQTPNHFQVVVTTLWSKMENNTDKIAIQSFTVPRARE